VPREVKEEENRVALTPSGVGALVAHGHAVLIEHGAGTGSRLPDARYRDAGATLTDAATVWARADLVLKVKEPQPRVRAPRPDVILFTYSTRAIPTSRAPSSSGASARSRTRRSSPTTAPFRCSHR